MNELNRPDSQVRERERVFEWLGQTRPYPVRIVCAPVGSGKTWALKRYVADSNGAAVYVRMSATSTPADLDEAGSGAAEIALDDVDSAPPRVFDALVERLLDANSSQRYIISGTGRQRSGLPELLLSGRATAIDPSLFTLTAEEIASLAVAANVRDDAKDVAALLDATEGWPLAVTGIVRFAAEMETSLEEAIDPWCRERGELVLEHLEGRIPEGDGIRDLLDEVVSGPSASSRRHLERLESFGFPIHHTPEGLRPYRIVEHIVQRTRHDVNGTGELPLLLLNLFGRFRCEINGREVPFQRRREKNVLAYVALAENGQRTREELMAAFWPGVSQSAASQNLRTALCRIRGAIAENVGVDVVDRYFKTAGEVKLNAELLVLDVRRFTNHVNQGIADEAAGAETAARYHYAAAERQFGDGLMASEGVEPCFATPAAEFERTYEDVLGKLARLAQDKGENDRARDYLLRLSNRTHQPATLEPMRAT